MYFRPRGGKIRIMNPEDEEALQEISEHDYNPLLACFTGRVSDQHSVRGKENESCKLCLYRRVLRFIRTRRKRTLELLNA
jgi:hypothetical protein